MHLIFSVMIDLKPGPFWCFVCRHQAGWFPFNLDNELQLPGDRANPDDAEGEARNQDLQEMVAASH